MLNFIETFKDEEYVDYDIMLNGKLIGAVQLVISDNIFIRHVRVNKQYRRLGYGTKIIDSIFKKYNKPIKLCISTISQSASPFWNKYFLTCKKVNNIRGNIYEIEI